MTDGEITWPCWWDGDKEDGPGPIASAWNIRGYPTFILLDHRGVIRSKGDVHPSDVRTFDEAVDRLLRTPRPTPRADDHRLEMTCRVAARKSWPSRSKRTKNNAKAGPSRNSAVGRQPGTLIPGRVTGRLSGRFSGILGYSGGECRKSVPFGIGHRSRGGEEMVVSAKAVPLSLAMKHVALIALNLALLRVCPFILQSPPLLFALVMLDLVLAPAVILGRPLHAFHYTFFAVGLAASIGLSVIAFANAPPGGRVGSLGILEPLVGVYRDRRGSPVETAISRI